MKNFAQILQKHFELRDKPQKLLAHQLKQTQASRAIHTIKSKDGNILVDPQKINECFAEFYTDIYKSQGQMNNDNVRIFFFLN